VTSVLKTVGLVPHRERALAHVLAAQAAKWLTDHGVSVRVPEDDAGPCGLDHLACPQSEFATGLDVVISLGGDGTMLRTVDMVYEAGVPVLGVNVGDLGYLTEVDPDPEAIKRALE
jgi:NAD+ kinase